MPLHVGQVIVDTEFVLRYEKGKEAITVAAPNKDDAKELFTWLKTQVFP